MVIRHINTAFMKHGRWVFGIFTIVIIISFVGFMIPGQFGFGGCTDPMSQPVGRAFGEDISYREAGDAIQQIMLVNELLYNRQMRVNDDYQQGFLIAVNLRVAEQRGISASNAEVEELIRSMAAFQKDGKFDYELYRKTVADLRLRGIDGDFLAEAIRNMVVLNKFQTEQMDSVIVTPGEAEIMYRFYNEKYTIRTAEFKWETYAKDVKVDDAALQSYFSANQQKYVIPAQLKALIAEFPYDDPAALADAAKVTDKDVRDFFDRNQDSFRKADGKLPKFEEVAASAKSQLIASRVRTAVNQKAQRFARDAYEVALDAKEPVAEFQKMLQAAKGKMIQSGVFGADAVAIGKIAEPELVKQIEATVLSAPVSQAVAGKRAAYVACLQERQDERPALLKEVTDRVRADFIREKATALALEAAQKTAAELAKLDAAKRGAAKCWKGNYDVRLMDYMERPANELPNPVIIESLPTLGAGQISPVLPTLDGAMLSMVVKRTAPDMKNFAAVSQLWKNLWFQEKMQLESAAFEKYLSDNCAILEQQR